MDKKPLIGVCICAVVLLVLGSLSNVVGYQSVKSTVNDSPLFQTRTQRATNQQQNSITSQYIGMGKENLLQFPIRDDRNEQLRKVIDLMSKMDDESFERITERCIQRIQQDKSLKDANPNEIVKWLKIARTNAKLALNPLINRDNQLFSASRLVTICFWFPGCIPYFIIASIVVIILNLLFKNITSGNCLTSIDHNCLHNQ